MFIMLLFGILATVSGFVWTSTALVPGAGSCARRDCDA